MMAIKDKFRNAEFVEHVERWATQLATDPNWDACRDDATTTQLWSKIMEDLKHIAPQYYAKDQTPAAQSNDVEKIKADFQERYMLLCQNLTSTLKPVGCLHKIIIMWRYQINTDKLSRAIRSLDRKDRDNRKSRLRQELLQAWIGNDPAHVWKVGKLLAGKAALRAKKLVRLSADGWNAGLARVGCKGGYLATPIDDWSGWAAEQCSTSNQTTNPSEAPGRWTPNVLEPTATLNPFPLIVGAMAIKAKASILFRVFFLSLMLLNQNMF
jgi:hypothetical protein